MAKSEALVNNKCKQKKIKSCNAKRRTTMKMASRLIDLISKKTNCTCNTLFLLISKKTNLHLQHAFLSFPCRCFARLQRCFVRLKCQTS